MAMLTTPARSPSTPPSAPKTSGIASATAPPSRLTTRIRPSAAAQLRKPTIQAKAKAIASHCGWRARASRRRTDSAVTAAQTSTMIQAVTIDGTVMSGSVTKSEPAASWKVVSPECPAPIRTRARTRLSTPNMIGSFLDPEPFAGVTRVSGARPPLSAGVGVVTVLTWPPGRGAGRSRAPEEVRRGRGR